MCERPYFFNDFSSNFSFSLRARPKMYVQLVRFLALSTFHMIKLVYIAFSENVNGGIQWLICWHCKGQELCSRVILQSISYTFFGKPSKLVCLEASKDVVVDKLWWFQAVKVSAKQSWESVISLLIVSKWLVENIWVDRFTWFHFFQKSRADKFHLFCL